jgi:cell division protein FtsI (penicillin-binding protein 3)
MTAPTKTRPRASVDWSTTERRRIPAQRGSVTVPTQRKGAAKAAYAKRDERARRAAPRALTRKATQLGTGRAQFVLLIMGLFVTGLVLTLWLSTAAAGGSYTLQQARTQARDLTEQSERLHREVAAMEAAPALAQRAAELGMVPVQDPARLVVAPDGSVKVVGDTKAAVRTAEPAVPTNPMPATQTGPSQTAADAQAQAPAAAQDEASTQRAQQAPPEQTAQNPNPGGA